MFRRSAVLASFLPLAVSGAVLAHGFKQGDIRVMHSWATVAAEGVYMTLTNAGAEPDKLVAVEAEAAGRVEIQKAKRGGGDETIPVVELGAKKTVAMQPGGMRVLLIDLKEPLRHEYTLPLTLVFERAGRVDIQAVIQKSAAEGHTH
ncbi:MAG: copper chaperone PCu(A)C [Alphaproteobacteria bacterium]